MSGVPLHPDRERGVGCGVWDARTKYWEGVSILFEF